jgi:hypothetical protein
MPPRDQLLKGAVRLHAYLLGRHCDGGLLHGPDAGVRFNLRFWRFLKSALNFVPWRDDYVFVQTQGYWILANWMLYESTRDPHYREVVMESSEATLGRQSPEGFWIYPLPERKHLVATVEGNWGALGLLATYAREREERYLAAVVRWRDFLVKRIGFQRHRRGEAINYFDKPRGKIPNNSVEAVWLFTRLWKATGEPRHLEHVDTMLEFIAAEQLPSGEFPYIVEGPWEGRREHYLCFQYNAFQFLKLAWTAALQPRSLLPDVLRQSARFLEKGVTATGASAASCHKLKTEMDYHTAVLGAALFEAERLGLVEQRGLSEHCFARLLARQRPDGSFAYSSGDYGFLRDGRSYPRQMAMTLFHLLYPCCGDGFPGL